MNIQEAEDHLNSVLVHIDLYKDRLGKTYAQQKDYERTLEELKQEASHWTNVISMMKLKANIQLANNQ